MYRAKSAFAGVASLCRRSPGRPAVLKAAMVGMMIAVFSGAGQAQAPDSCAMLEDPVLRPMLGSALETKLHVLCQELKGSAAPEAESLGPQETPTEKLEEHNAFFSGPDQLVNDPNTDVGGSTQSETSITRAGLFTLCAAWNDSGQVRRPRDILSFGLSGFGYSPNLGDTWVDGGFFPPGPPPFRDTNFGDPSLADSLRDRAVYYAAISVAGLGLWKSTDRCRSFRYVGPIHFGFGDDKELMAIDNNPFSPFFGRIYVGWTNFSLFFQGRDVEQVTYSDDGGLTWSLPATLPGSGLNAQGMWPAIAPNGDVYFAFLDRSFRIRGTQDQRIFKSVDGGDNWFEVTPIGQDQLRPEKVASSRRCSRQALNGDIRNLSSPQIAIHKVPFAPAGYVIHAVYPYDSDGRGPDNSNVFYRRSDDGGSTWSPEVQLNDDTTDTDQWFPALGVNPFGHVVVSWYDRRLDPLNNLSFDRFAVISLDGGLTWGPNKRVSDVSSPVSQNNPHFDGLATCYHGDYDQLVVGLGQAHIIWSDDRRIVPPHGPDPDVWFDNLFLFGNDDLAELK